MPQGRDQDSGKFIDTYTDDEFRAAIREHDGVAGTSEIAETVGCTSRHALNRLRELQQRGEVTAKDVGRSFVWMLPTDGDHDE